jgi:hypothetical protein
MAENPPRKQLERATVSTGLRSFGNLHNYSDIQRRGAAGAPLTLRDMSALSAKIDFSRHGVRADRAMYLPFRVILNECFHGICLTSSDAVR